MTYNYNINVSSRPLNRHTEARVYNVHVRLLLFFSRMPEQKRANALLNCVSDNHRLKRDTVKSFNSYMYLSIGYLWDFLKFGLTLYETFIPYCYTVHTYIHTYIGLHIVKVA